jgi:hypothetical protein
VNPIITGRGINFTADPKPVTPIITSRPPAISVTSDNPSNPNRATMPATITTKAPVGPQSAHADPPRADIKNPATTAV